MRLGSEQSWTQEDKQLVHPLPRSRLKPEMEMQRDEWAEGKKTKQRKTQATRDQRQTDR